MNPFVFLALILMACGGGTSEPKPDDTGAEADTDTDTDADTDTDTDTDVGTDNDGDGFTVEDGDCDDDNIYVNPARDEEPDNDIDDDCDGRVDEDWNGVTVTYFNDDGAADLWTIDSLGNLTDEITLTDTETQPLWLVHDQNGGYVANTGYSAVVHIDDAGTVTTWADYSKSKDVKYGIYGICAHPNGYVIAMAIDSMWRVASDGTSELLASWSVDTKAKDFALYGYSCAADLMTGEIGIFGYYGGFAVWTEDEGFDVLKSPDPKNWDGIYAYSGAYKDGGGWFSLTYNSMSYSAAISRFNEGDRVWVEKAVWDVDYWFPNTLTVDGDEGDYYVTANAGWYYTVWRVLQGGDYATDLFITDGTVGNRGFYGIVSNY